MFIVESYPLAVAMCLITMLCWGSWANTQKLASKEWRFQLFYWDYAIGVFLFSLLFSHTLGSFGTAGVATRENLHAANWGFVLPAVYGLNRLLDRFYRQRIAPEGERQGLDLYELGAGAYPDFMTHSDDSWQR